jgi:hypothetical protein
VPAVTSQRGAPIGLQAPRRKFRYQIVPRADAVGVDVESIALDADGKPIGPASAAGASQTAPRSSAAKAKNGEVEIDEPLAVPRAYRFRGIVTGVLIGLAVVGAVIAMRLLRG